jgi:hypothetical protein
MVVIFVIILVEVDTIFNKQKLVGATSPTVYMWIPQNTACLLTTIYRFTTIQIQSYHFEGVIAVF